ncbi:MAG TPA: hypothetical protein ENL27_00660 [Candidatus Parcubacteria bacterium]|nr:hypothetical protein [Candidatus Parcubacteria bacterium]
MNILSKISKFVQRLLAAGKKYESEIILFIGVVLVSLLSFAVGYIAAKNQCHNPVRIEKEGGLPIVSNINYKQ